MSEYVNFINHSSTNDAFPAQFSNQIFFSDHVTDITIEYETVYSIKYQISGHENYELCDSKFILPSNNYLIVNDNQRVICNSAPSEKAISIFIDPATLKDVFRNLKNSDESLLDNPFNFLKEEILFFENTYPVDDNLVSKKLEYLKNLFTWKNVNTKSFNIDFFYEMSRLLILSQNETFKQINNSGFVKVSTKTEIFKRMLKSKSFIIDNWNEQLSIENIASEVFMSPYHFHRIFSATFETTPLKFHKKCKFQKLKKLIHSNQFTISEIAELGGFSNIYSFSKAFKNFYGYPPSKCFRKFE